MDPKDALWMQGHIYSRRAAFIVSVMSVLFVLGLLGYLFFSAYLQSEQFHIFNGNGNVRPAPNVEIHASQLEAEYQRLKAMRFSYALIYRFSLSAAAIMVSLALIVLGSVMVFDRVASPTTNTAGASLGHPQGNWSVNSHFAGLIMVFFGAATLSLSVYFAGPGAPEIRISDVPVFTPDRNFYRHQSGVFSTLNLNPKSNDQTLPLIFDLSSDGEPLSTQADPPALSQGANP